MRRKHIVIVVAALLAFIWVQSLVPEIHSAGESMWITEHIINPLLTHLGLPGVEDNTVRKAAHVAEYLVLGIFVSMLWEGDTVRTVYTGFTIAFLDETIQVLSGRGALITDVWVDLIGVAIGTGVGYAIARRAGKGGRGEGTK